MKIESFSRQISSYIDFKSLHKVVAELKDNSSSSKEKTVLLLGSEHLKKAEDWDLYNLIRDFLKEFRIPKESLELLVQLNENLSMDDEEIKWLANYKFTGELRGNPKLQNHPHNLSFTPLIAIIAESCILDILYYPVNFLVNSVEVLSKNWRQMQTLNARAFFEPGTPSELLVYIEKRVASQYEHLERTDAGQKAGNSVFNGYRYVCMTSDLPIDSKLVSITKQASNNQATSTHS